ncbi:RKIN1 [Symbiodinium sp. CCMP2456]|nr:RKIN1 [Symbiodinium sp. CCMP2456]
MFSRAPRFKNSRAVPFPGPGAYYPKGVGFTAAYSFGPPKSKRQAKPLAAVPVTASGGGGPGPEPLDAVPVTASASGPVLLTQLARRVQEEGCHHTPPESMEAKTQILASVDLEQLVLGEQLGQGGLARVCTAKTKNHLLAAKLYWQRYGLLPGQEEQDRASLKSEADLLWKLRHPNIVSVVALIVQSGLVQGMVLELCGPSLQAATQQERLAATHLASLLHPTCSGIEYLHSNLVAHLDIKGSNVTLHSAFGIKIIDFDAALVLHSPHQKVRRLPGNTCRLSPEAGANRPYSPLQEDAFAVGAMFTDIVEDLRVQQGELSWEAKVLQARVRCLSLPAEDRPTMSDMLQDRIWRGADEVLAEQVGMPTATPEAACGNVLAKLFG